MRPWRCRDNHFAAVYALYCDSRHGILTFNYLRRNCYYAQEKTSMLRINIFSITWRETKIGIQIQRLISLLFLFFQIHQVETTMFTSATRIEKYLAILMMLASFVALLGRPDPPHRWWRYMVSPTLWQGDGGAGFTYCGSYPAQLTPASNDITYCAWIGELLLFSFTLTGETGVIVFRYFAMKHSFSAPCPYRLSA